MNQRQRIVNTLLFKDVDKIPLDPGHARKSTREQWRAQGLPRTIDNINEYAYRQAGGQMPWPTDGAGFAINERLIPEFEEKILERRERTLIVQDWKGNICEISAEFDPSYLRNAIDFVTRRWIKCPVETWSDWEAMQRRYDPDDPTRFPNDAAVLGRQLADRDWIIEITLPGPFWQMREWVGFERLCMLFYDDPALIRDMVAFWQDYIAALLRNVFRFITPDILHISEDMAYKQHPMISPKMTREFLLPTYKTWGDIILGHGCPIYAMDSDGYIADLIPIWIDAGMNVCDPVEVAAGNDLAAFRQRFGRTMAFRGGVDKRAMAKGGATIEAEIQRLRPVIDDGGYIPGCDHGIPSDVAWPDYVDYVKLLAQATGWL